MLSSPKAQPFGLLSSKAVVDFKVGSRVVPDPKYSFRYGSWKTVTQYVYVNMFKNEKYRVRMSELLHAPFSNMLRLREEEDVEIYNKAVLKGLRERFRQHDELMTRLYQTRGKQLVYDNKDVLMLLNQLRLKNNKQIYDPKQGKDVPRVEVLQVISGVEDELVRNPSLPDMDFVALKRYAKRYGYKDLPLNDEIFLNINHIVPVVKYRLRSRLWNQELERFKDHLLDVFLDYILEEDYPNVDPARYAEAKRQQIAKEPRLQVYKDQLYDLYIKGMKDNDHILQRLRFIPDKTLREMGHDACEIKKKLLAPKATTQAEGEGDVLGMLLKDMKQLHTPIVHEVEKIYIQPDDPFLPHYIEDVIVDDKMYASAVHYAYAQMISNLLEIGELQGLDAFDVNTVDLRDIISTYNDIKRDWMAHNLKANNEAAIGMKFDQSSTLVHLLLATRNSNLVWNDKSDPVLGEGTNSTGQLLMYVRDSYMNAQLQNNRISSYGSIAGNVWTNSWMMSMAQDFKNAMLLLKNPATSDLVAIYSVQSVQASPGTDDVQTLHRAGLNDAQIAIAFPVIVAMYIPMRDKTEGQLMNDEADVYFMENDYRGKMNKFKIDLQHARDRLEKMSELFQLADGVDGRTFALSILGNKKTSNKEDARWSRVYKWSH